MIIHNDIEQRSPEWFDLRLGRITGTRIAEMAAGKPATFENLCRKIAAEIITGVSAEKPFRTTEAMEHGIETEDEARAAYEIETMTHVQQVGFISSGDLFGCSPDGLIGEAGMVELKAPMAHTHLGYLTANGYAHKAYHWQLMGQLWCSGRGWVDFCSYNPLFGENKNILIERVFPNNKDLELIEAKALQLKDEVSRLLRIVQ